MEKTEPPPLATTIVVSVNKNLAKEVRVVCNVTDMKPGFILPAQI